MAGTCSSWGLASEGIPSLSFQGRREPRRMGFPTVSQTFALDGRKDLRQKARSYLGLLATGHSVGVESVVLRGVG